MIIDGCADGWHGLGTLSMALGDFERARILYDATGRSDMAQKW